MRSVSYGKSIELSGTVAVFTLLTTLFAAVTSGQESPRPNIILILVDDMGFSDLGCYGGEIETPHLDELASGGIRFTQFYNCAKCETTRASLLSGRYHTEPGVAKLAKCVTIAERMKAAGYTTLMTGKWHMNSNPVKRGFERYFGHLSGACNFFTGDNTFRLNDQPFKVPQKGFYTTDANTEYAIRFLKERRKDKPFFLYLAYNAPHYPLHAPEKEVKKYRGKYRGGWDVLRRRRLRSMKELGIVPPEQKLTPRPNDVPEWDSLSDKEQDIQDLMMATYAGMIDRVDQNIGKLVEFLGNDGSRDNTLIFFLSDNGACPFQRTTPETREKMLMPWTAESYWTYDKGWAHACNTPFREYKRDQHEGGISTPFIINWPKGIRVPGTITGQQGHLVDIMATSLDLAGAKPGEKARGSSLAPIFRGQRRQDPEYLFFSFYGQHNALRIGNWKLVNKNSKPFELYNLQRDRGELNNLAKKEPEQFSAMKDRWDDISKAMSLKVRKKRNRNKKKQAKK